MFNRNPTMFMGMIIVIVLTTACTILVLTNHVSGETFMAAVVGPLIGGVVGIIGHARGVTQGSEVTVAPPPSS